MPSGIKQCIAINRINDNFNVVEETKSGHLNQSTDEVHTLFTDKLNEILDGSSTTPQVDDKELETVIIATIVT